VLLAFAALVVTPALFGATPEVRVRGSAKISAAAAASEESAVVAGTLLDDTGRPVGGATLRIRGVALDGTTLPLPALVACAREPPPGGFRPGGSARRAEQSVTTDAAGRFCVSTDAGGLAALTVTFADERGLLDAAEEKVTIDRSRHAVELRLLPLTATFEVERETQRVQVNVRSVSALSPVTPPLPLAVYALTPNAETLLAQGACPMNGATELEFATSKLAGPGPIELALRFAGSATLQPAEARRRVLATARVRLALSRAPAAADPTDGVVLDVALGSAAGAVDKGSVEARLDGKTVGIAPVARGAARVVAQFPRRGPNARLELRYLPTEPWWRPGEPLAVDVGLLAQNRWPSLAWLGLLGALALWLVGGWRRPERSERAAAAGDAVALRVAGVHVIQRDDEYIGWRGVVRDAHDEHPLEGALVSLVGVAPERRVHARVSADHDGRFELSAPSDGAVELLVTARLHSDFSCPAPPHGELRVDLVSRRRHVLDRLVRWAERRGPLGRARAEPTPGDVKRHGRRAHKDDIVEWAGAVEAAAYGPGAVDESVEQDVNRKEPPDRIEAREPRR